MFQNLVNYKGISKLKKAALNLLIRQAMIDNNDSDDNAMSDETTFLTRKRAE